MEKSDYINCGERMIQGAFRIALKDICNSHGIVPGDYVEVYIKKVKK